jgi:hypothetical protein
MKITGAAVGALLVNLVLWVAQVWVAMLALGAAHTWDDRIPALGFGAMLWLVLAVRVALMGLPVDKD